ncbi:protein translocase subunit secF [Bisgaardia hudsonensis]|uniref:Protein-export membrane protein SecF n=1 Tax=Bisgaardia hudsonensis TaxID=109472 RepID=A0A4R2N3B4_9PAST|nr:protein translocase subunit SecF [Bisgaardia hudsonensis]QLB12847.1 protein-export membrane protein SecF [Bisgaardia hudsonensis]TCP14406.1 protein translocase subunit secF [Bisgaardia hudsonensis]
MSLFRRKEKYDHKGIILPFKLIPFTKYRFVGYAFSLFVTILSIFFIVTKGFNWGLDFTGGTVVQTTFSQPADLPKVRDTLKANGFPSAIVQTNGGVKDVMIRLSASAGDAKIGNEIKDMLVTLDNGIQVLSVDFVGPNVGEELTQGAIYATLATLLLLLAYIGLRFEWRLAVGGIVALAHDVMVTLGIFSFFQIEMDLTFVAAILSVVGYSLNDSIVVFDRVRENFRKIRRVETLEIIDISLTQTLARTLMTSITTLFVVVSLFIFGGPTIHSFSLALLIGIAFGTYSTIYIAISVALDLGLKREHMIIKKVSKEDIEEMP